jgi:hypothetical protein
MPAKKVTVAVEGDPGQVFIFFNDRSLSKIRRHKGKRQDKRQDSTHAIILREYPT